MDAADSSSHRCHLLRRLIDHHKDCPLDELTEASSKKTELAHATCSSILKFLTNPEVDLTLCQQEVEI